MQYKVTRQYSRDIESPLAEFVAINDAEMFISNKSADDTAKASLLIYRLYNNDKLVIEYNKDQCKSPIARAQYANGDIDLPEHFADPYRVTYRGTDNKEYILGTFREIEDARLFIESKFLSNEHNNKNNPTYMIYKLKQLVEIIDQKSIDMKKEQGSQDKTKKLAFRPTPLSTKLTMGPKNWLVEEDDDGENNNSDK